MSYLQAVTIAISTFAFVVSLVALLRSNERYANHKMTRQLSELRAEMLGLADEVGAMRRLAQRMVARDNMRAAREKKKEMGLTGAESDEAFLKSVELGRYTRHS